MTTSPDSPCPESTASAPKRSGLYQALSRVCAQWPALWPEWQRRHFRPMAIGTGQKMHDWLKAHPDSALTHHDIARVMRSVARYTTYLEQMVSGATRYNLNGEPEGTVTAKDEEWSRQTLAEVRLIRSRRDGDNRTGESGTA